MHTVILFYKFTPIDDPVAFRDEQRALCEKLGLTGRMLIAHEGVNATFEGTNEAIETYKAHVHADPRFAGLVFKESEGTGHSFNGLRFRIRPEIVTLGAGEFDVPNETAKEVTAEELQAMYARNDDFVVLDLRNDYEINAGYFEKTEHPNLRNFRDLPEKLDSIKHLKDKKVVAVCTGGIRCEKATCLLQKEGFTNLYQLKDGIHTYMQQFPGQHFKGTLFVFDNRMTTEVAESASREVVGTCTFCGARSEDFYSDDSVRPSLKIICCSSCIKSRPDLRATATVS